MVNYVKTTNGYFYKICKNGKKRISEDEYNKQTKIKKMTGGVNLETINIDESKSRDVMDNVFMTGDISSNGKTSNISKISKQFMKNFTSFKTNNNEIEKQRRIESNLGIVDITYVGEIRYSGPRHSGISGTSNIWVQKNVSSKKVSYIVEIQKDRNNDQDKSNFGKHVHAALKNLCDFINIDLLIKALSRIGVQLDGTRELIKIIDEISNIKKALSKLQQIKENLYQNRLSRTINDIDWTFTPPDNK